MYSINQMYAYVNDMYCQETRVPELSCGYKHL